MVGTHDAPGAGTARPVEQARAAVPADVMESTDGAVAAADGHQHGPDEIQALVVAGVRNVIDVADDLPGRAEYSLPFELQELRVLVGPRGKAEIVDRNLAQCAARIR